MIELILNALYSIQIPPQDIENILVCESNNNSDLRCMLTLFRRCFILWSQIVRQLVYIPKRKQAGSLELLFCYQTTVEIMTRLKKRSLL